MWWCRSRCGEYRQCRDRYSLEQYVNWLLSKQGQEAWQRIIGDPSLRVDISKTGLNPQTVPKEGVNYTPTGTEDYGRLQNGVIRGLIDDALKRKLSS